MSVRIRAHKNQRPKRLRSRKSAREAALDGPPGVCTRCGCTDNNCSKCIKAQGFACSWADDTHTICTRCA